MTLALALKQGNLSIPLAEHGLFPILLLALISYSGLPSIPGRDIIHRTVRLSVSCLERERLVEYEMIVCRPVFKSVSLEPDTVGDIALPIQSFSLRALFQPFPGQDKL